GGEIDMHLLRVHSIEQAALHWIVVTFQLDCPSRVTRWIAYGIHRYAADVTSLFLLIDKKVVRLLVGFGLNSWRMRRSFLHRGDALFGQMNMGERGAGCFGFAGHGMLLGCDMLRGKGCVDDD